MSSKRSLPSKFKDLNRSANDNKFKIDLYPFKITLMEKKIKIYRIQETIQEIGPKACCNNLNLQYVYFPASMRAIGQNCFLKCRNLKKIVFPRNSCLISIGNNAFESTKIRSVVFPASLEKIGYHIFDYCKIESIMFEKKSKLRIMHENLLENCKNIEFLQDNSFNIDLYNLISQNDSDSENLNIISQINMMKSLNLPPSLEKLKSGSFKNYNFDVLNYGLTSHIEKIESFAF